MSFLASSAASSSSFAAISFALSSRTSEPSQMMRSFSSRSKTPVPGVGSAMCRSVSVVAFTRIYPVQRTRTGLFALGGCGELGGVCGDRDAVPREVRREGREGDGCRVAGVARIDECERAERRHGGAKLARLSLDGLEQHDRLEGATEVANSRGELDVRLHVRGAGEPVRDGGPVEELGLCLEARGVARARSL